MSVWDLVEERVWLTVIVCLVVLFTVYQALFWLVSYCRGSQFKKEWYGKHILITGGSKGLGYELAVILVQRGARVTLLARNAESLSLAKQKLEELANTAKNASLASSQVLTISADVTNHSQLHQAIAAAEREMGPIFGLIPCAGASMPGYFSQIPMDEHRRTMELDYFSVLATVRAAVPGMMRRGEGHIIFVSSGLALTTYMGYSSYCPAKAAVRALADVLRAELAPYGVRIYNSFPRRSRHTHARARLVFRASC